MFCRYKITKDYEYFLQFFSVQYISQIKDFEAKGMQEILKQSSKTGHRFTAISNLQNNEERVSFQTGNKQLSF